ncbi:MAG: hypothetical protein Q4B90_09130 [Eubacteriales bacterium]|nr:hypothetical protein [Eubacteriales bacterium]
MVKKDINQMLIESVVRKTLKNISDSPKRSLRNSIDLALNFSSGSFQNRFLRRVQAMLQNQKSAYYKVAKNAANFVSHDTLCRFGINVGYNSCTKGVEQIRQTGKAEHFAVPWSLTFLTDSKSWTANKKFYEDFICQGMDLGIYTYFFFTDDPLCDFSSFLSSHPECAFVLFTTAEALTEIWLKDLKPFHNLMLSVRFSATSFDTAENLYQKLRSDKFLYSVCIEYNDFNKNMILDRRFFDSVLAGFPYFIFLFPDSNCSNCAQAEIYHTVNQIRTSQQYPAILFDLKYDTMLINRVISDMACTAVFDPSGRLYTDHFSFSNPFLLTHTLKSVFKIAFSK